MTQPTEPTAPDAAQCWTEAWKEAERLQRWTSGDHHDFYRLAGELDETLHALHGLAISLRSQVVQYDAHHHVFDDTRSYDPAVRLGDAARLLSLLAQALVTAERYAGEFHSTIGHIGTE